jgi:hypothetical protein
MEAKEVDAENPFKDLDLKLSKNDYKKINSGDQICDKHGKFTCYPKQDNGPTKREA